MSNFPIDDTKYQSNLLVSQDEDKIDLGELLDVLIDSKWLVTLVTVTVLFFGITKAFIDKPVFRTDVMLQVNETSQMLVEFEPLADILNNNTSVTTEIELIKSRMVLGAVVENLALDIIARPNYFPLIGEAIARRFQLFDQDNVSSNSILGKFHFAWGGEVIQIDNLIIPADWEDEELVLLAGEQGHFQLFYDGEQVLEGEVGKLASNQLKDKQQPITIFVSRLASFADTQFIVMRQSRGNAINQLRESLTIREKGKNTGILEIMAESYSPDSAVQILNEIANIYVQQNVEHKSMESQKKLAFLETQLPILKKQLEEATSVLNDYKNRKGSINLDIETQNILEGIVETKTQITLLQQRRDEFRQRYTASHPNVIAVDKQIARLLEQLSLHESMIKTLPETQQVILALSGDVNVNAELYATLLNNAQTLRVAKAGTVGDVRVVDYAILPDEAIRPQKILIISVSLALGLFLGVIAAFIRKSLRYGIEDPDVIEKYLNVPVYVTIPHSKKQEILDAQYRKLPQSNNNPPVILALENKEDFAVESLRSLRTTLHFSLLESQNNIILITGPSSGVGKSFVAVNLAAVMADAGKKVLLIDGDMRNGVIHKSLGVRAKNGLSEIISGVLTKEGAIHKVQLANFDFISTGTIPPNPSELLLHEHFGVFLESVTSLYDFIIVDSPPILAVTDAAIIGRLAGAVFMVVKSGEHSMRELDQSTRRLVMAGANMKGIIFNDLPLLSSRMKYSDGKYVNQYSYNKSSK